jgi:hypothetical protein
MTAFRKRRFTTVRGRRLRFETLEARAMLAGIQTQTVVSDANNDLFDAKLTTSGSSTSLTSFTSLGTMTDSSGNSHVRAMVSDPAAVVVRGKEAFRYSAWRRGTMALSSALKPPYFGTVQREVLAATRPPPALPVLFIAASNLVRQRR